MLYVLYKAVMQTGERQRPQHNRQTLPDVDDAPPRLRRSRRQRRRPNRIVYEI